MDKSSSLTPLQRAVLFDKATESPFTGEYTDTDNAEIDGTYLCRNCGLALFRATNKFHSGCGWPSFDVEIDGAVLQIPDNDGMRTEIVCARCNGHLGHVFKGEHFTALNTRHCVNSASLDFATDTQIKDSEEIILAAGCFWGVEYYLQKLDGVVLTQVGYCGGHVDNPSYEDVCTNKSGHLEVVRVIFDPNKLSLTKLLKYFFEIHDGTQSNGQGPDIGTQYLSAIFCYNPEQKEIASKVIQSLPNAASIITSIRDMATFWIAEEYHRNYFYKKGIAPSCHV